MEYVIICIIDLTAFIAKVMIIQFFCKLQAFIFYGKTGGSFLVE